MHLKLLSCSTGEGDEIDGVEGICVDMRGKPGGEGGLLESN